MSFAEKCYWLETVSMPPANAAGPLPEKTDVAVIGAGFTGLSAARTLAKRGARVAVLEAETIGWGASSRNGGMVLSGLKLGASELLAKFGRETARRMFAASLAAIDCVERIVREEGIACDFSRSGHLEVASKPAHFVHFRAQAELLDTVFNHHVQIVPRADLGGAIGSDLYHGGLVDEISAGVNPARFVAGLAQAAMAAGASVYEQTRVQGIEPCTLQGSSGYRLGTSRGNLWAREVFVATGGYTREATPALRKSIIPIGSYVIATEPLPEDLARHVSPHNRLIYDSKNYLYYFRLTPDRRMLFGGRAAFFPETENSIRVSAGILHRGLLKVFPQLAGVKVAAAWGGTLDFAADRLPHAGQLDGLYYALGYAGHGVAMATYLGAEMGELISGTRRDNPFIGLSFPRVAMGLYNGRPWFLPIVGAWFKFLDWIS